MERQDEVELKTYGRDKMNQRVINKLRRNFMLVAMVSFVAVMLAMGGIIYLTNLAVTRHEIRKVMNYIVRNEGRLPGSVYETEMVPDEDKPDADKSDADKPDADKWSDQVFDLSWSDYFGWRDEAAESPEFLYSTRYFAVRFDQDERVTDVVTSRIAAFSDEQAEEYARSALHRFWRFGSYGVYYYLVSNLSDGGKMVVYLDSSNQVLTSNRLLITILSLVALGIIIMFFLVRYFSYRIVQPEIRNAEKQKQFLTNASHELKTPLSVIRANTELDMMLNGENEWNQSTMRQVDRMTGLIQNLVLISRAAEQEDGSERTMTDLSAAVEETVDTFSPIAMQENKALKKSIHPGIKMEADGSQIRQLASLLTDNAIKYCDEAGTIEVSLTQRGKTVRLVVSNTYAAGGDVDYSRFFERFYRQDEAHDTEKGGYGIGLSIAESIVEQYNGTIDAAWKDGIITFTCLLKF